MPETGKTTLTSRTESHSDVANTDAARAHQAAMTERQFGDTMVRRIRETKGEGALVIRNFREEWLNTDDGLVYEISVDVEQTE
jgi:hypothetical protein